MTAVQDLLRKLQDMGDLCVRGLEQMNLGNVSYSGSDGGGERFL